MQVSWSVLHLIPAAKMMGSTWSPSLISTSPITRVATLPLIRTTTLLACSRQRGVVVQRQNRRRRRLRLRARCEARHAFDDEIEEKGTVEDLRIPHHWLNSSVARKEKHLRINTKADKIDAPILENDTEIGLQADGETSKKLDGNVDSGVPPPLPSVSPAMEKDLKKVVNKAAATFAPRASTATKNPAVPGTALYTIFEVQGYASMFLGGVLSFNLIFPSNEPDIWRLMGMWSIWMFTIPSLRARDCSNKEKEALNYLFLLIPLLNVMIPFFVKSFAVVWTADTIAFFAMYAWKLGWLQNKD